MPRTKRPLDRKSRTARAVRAALHRLGKTPRALAMEVDKRREVIARIRDGKTNVSLEEAARWEAEPRTGLRTGEISSAVASDITMTTTFVGIQVGSGSDAFRDALVVAQEQGKPNPIWIAVEAAEAAGQRPKPAVTVTYMGDGGSAPSKS